jgi:hypothetical protein
MNMVATAVEKGAVDGKFFQHPAGIAAEEDAEADTMARDMAKQVIARLVDPENAPKSELQPMGVPGAMEGMSDEDKQMMQQLEKMMQGMKGTTGQ